MKILIVDDSLTYQRKIKICLKELGYKNILVSSSAKRALEQLKTDKVDLILLDWHMPEINGFELLVRLKKNKRLKKIPVIMLTTENDMKLIVDAIENGAEGYILKPLNKDLLKTRLQDIESNRILGFKKD